MLKPKAIFERITDIPPEFFEENNIEGIILDVDNTLIDLKKTTIEGIEDWVNNVKKRNIKICIASNSMKKHKVEAVAKKLDIPFVYFSKKPLKRGLKKAIKILKIKNENIAEIGDQLFTDVLGANRLKMFSILTTPIELEKSITSKLKRKIEKIVLNKIL